MKTRILHTKIWQDELVAELSPVQKLLFIYYLTNDNIGLTGIYELTDRQASFDTGLNKTQIAESKILFEKSGKLFFYKNWIFVVNAQRLNGYHGTKLDTAIEKEKSFIPVDITSYFDRVSVNADRVSDLEDTPINHKSEIINHKSETRGIVKGDLESIDDPFLDYVAEKYQVPITFVRSKFDDMCNWVQEKPTRARGRDLQKTLMVWVKKDAIERREHANGKIKYVGEALTDSD